MRLPCRIMYVSLQKNKINLLIQEVSMLKQEIKDHSNE